MGPVARTIGLAWPPAGGAGGSGKGPSRTRMVKGLSVDVPVPAHGDPTPLPIINHMCRVLFLERFPTMVNCYTCLGTDMCKGKVLPEEKELFEVLRRIVINIIVARYRLLLAGCRIAVDVMTRPRAHQYTAHPFKLAYELSACHKAISFIS